MPGVRLHGLLASTAIVLMVSTGAGALAQSPANGPAVSAPDAAKDTPAAANQTDKAGEAAPQADAPAAPGAASTPSLEQANAPAAGGVPTSETVDATIAEQLHQLASGKFDHLLGGKAQRTEIEAFYASHNYAPLWITDGRPNERAKAAIKYLGHVDADGLEPADYPLPDFKALADPAPLAEAELRMTASVVTYARHASIGRIAWSRVSGDIGYEQKAPEPASVLSALADAKDAGAVLDSYEPHLPGYVALKAKLAEIRAGRADGTKPGIPSGPALKVGDQDDRVPQLREKLGVQGDGGSTYDKALAEAVKKFQKDHDLKPTGLLTPQTVDALNGPRPTHVTETILANLERWRWMPHDLGKTYVIVNLPDYTLTVMKNGAQIWKTRIVIGKPAMPTPIMSAQMKFITINPTWHVPPSIVNNEYLPAMAQDPTVMERMGLVVDRGQDGTMSIWQPPGDRNALGRIRFNFPNKFLVYQHDTPDKYMFNFDKRAFSHGCMRVFDPPKYAEVLLSLVRPGDNYTVERIKQMYGPSEINIDFPTVIPVHLTYQTAFVAGDGKLEFRDDVYGRDRELLALMNGPERKVADIPVEHRIDASHRQVLAVPDSPSFWGGGPRGYAPTSSGNGGGGFFARLFGGISTPQPPPQRPAARRKLTRAQNTVAQ